MKNLKEKGITLIALVITIIVLLILAGVTLSLIWNGGIIQKSQESVDVYSEKGAEEKLTLKLAEYKFALTAKEDPMLEEYLYQVSDEVTDNGDGTYMVVVDGYEFIVQEDPLQIIGKNGPATGEKPKITSVKKDYIADKNWVILKVTAEGVVGGEITVDIGGKRVEPNEDGTFTILRNGTYRILVLEEGNRRRISQTVEVDEIQPIYYEVTLTPVTGATVEGGGTIEEEKSTEIKATVNSGYKFEYWEVTEGHEEDVEDLNSAETKVTPTDKITLKAVVTEKSKYTITLTPVTGVTYSGGGAIVQETSTTIKATTDAGHDFIKWEVTSGDASVINDLYSAEITITPKGDMTLKAIISKKKLTDGDNLNGDENGTLNGKPSAYNNPIIPVGFKAVDWTLSDDGEYVKGWNDGLILQDKSGNQFVWVPVHTSDVVENEETISAVPYKKWCTIGSNSTAVTDDSSRLPSGVSSETKQIQEYGGFYISRYEAYTADSKNNIPGSKADKKPWVKINYECSRNYSKKMCDTSYVKSGLVTGTMWDTIMKWFANSGINVTSSKSWGNYNYKSWSAHDVRNTGSSTTYMKKNIYDLAGNVAEWNAEKSSGSFNIYRGGSAYGPETNPAAYRYYRGGGAEMNTVGFRVALYIL